MRPASKRRFLRRSERIGRIAPSLRADLAAFAGDPSQRVEAFRQPLLVLKDGVVHRSPEERHGSGRDDPEPAAATAQPVR